MLVRDIMTRDLVTVYEDCTVEICAKLLNEHNVSGLPVVSKEGKLVGIVTEGDLIRRAAEVKGPSYLEILGGIIYFDTPKEVLNDFRKAMGKMAVEVMTREVVSVNENKSVEDAATILVRKKLKMLPVTNDGGNLVGVIARKDILHYLYGEE